MNEIPNERQSDGTAAPEPEFKQEAERRLPCTTCCASSFWFVGARNHPNLDAVAKEYRRTYDSLPEDMRPKALVVWGDIMGSLIMSDALMHYGLPTIRLVHSVGGRDNDAGVIPDIVGQLQNFMEDFYNYVTVTKESSRRNATRPDEVSDSDKRMGVAGLELAKLRVRVRAFVPADKGGDVSLNHGVWESEVSAQRQSDGTAAPEPEFKQEAERRLPCTSCSS